MSDLIRREDAIETIHNYWKKRLDTLPTTDIQQMDKIFEHNKTLCNFINAIPSADRPQGKWIIHYRDKLMVKAECPKCHRRFQFSPRGIWKRCPMCETRMKGVSNEADSDKSKQ